MQTEYESMHPLGSPTHPTALSNCSLWQSKASKFSLCRSLHIANIDQQRNAIVRELRKQVGRPAAFTSNREKFRHARALLRCFHHVRQRLTTRNDDVGCCSVSRFMNSAMLRRSLLDRERMAPAVVEEYRMPLEGDVRDSIDQPLLNGFPARRKSFIQYRACGHNNTGDVGRAPLTLLPLNPPPQCLAHV
jgi:hypothetical protein